MFNGVSWSVGRSVGQSVLLNKVHGVLKVRSNAFKNLKLVKWLQVSAIMNLQMISLRLHDYENLPNFPPEDKTSLIK